MLDIVDLAFDCQDKRLLHHHSFHLPAGGLLHLQGENGVGKTTLLKLIVGLYPISNGQIYFAGKAIETQRLAYQQNVCFIGHKPGINLCLTVEENWLFDLHYRGQPIKQLARVFNLSPHLHTRCGLLSAGQQRQVALVRLWMTKARLWLLDEPFTALDEKARLCLMKKIDLHRSEGGAVILTSHQPLPLAKSAYEEYFL